MSNKMKYTTINKSYPPAEYPSPVTLAASQYLNPLSGRVLTKDGNGNYTLAVAGDTQVAGFTDTLNQTPSASDGIDGAILIDDINQAFEMPVSGATLTAANLKTYIGKTCDIATAGTGLTLVQSANLAASATDVLKIVGGNVDLQTVYVRLNPTKMFTAGVA